MATVNIFQWTETIQIGSDAIYLAGPDGYHCYSLKSNRFSIMISHATSIGIHAAVGNEFINQAFAVTFSRNGNYQIANIYHLSAPHGQFPVLMLANQPRQHNLASQHGRGPVLLPGRLGNCWPQVVHAHRVYRTRPGLCFIIHSGSKNVCNNPR